jgi:nicotinamide-nucleotide amidase
MSDWAEVAELSMIAKQLADLLSSRRRRLVLAESCTGGLAAAALATVPGISEWFCGSVVAYRESSKTVWLGLSADLLAKFSAVSAETSRALAASVLVHTPEADWSAAITGHLGPGAPTELDGVGFIAVGRRSGSEIEIVGEQSLRLQHDSRSIRQVEAAAALLTACQEYLSNLA